MVREKQTWPLKQTTHGAPIKSKATSGSGHVCGTQAWWTRIIRKIEHRIKNDCVSVDQSVKNKEFYLSK